MWDQEIYKQAIVFAGDAHQEQKIPGSQRSYVSHLARVAMEIMSAWVASTEKFQVDYAIQCALLHDAIEDTEVTFEQVKQTFGDKVAQGVLALTKNTNLPKPAQMPDSLQRILQQPFEVRLVKMCDRIDNLSKPPHYWDKAKKQRYQQEAQLILETLGGVNTYIEERLQQKITEYKQYFDVK